MARDFGGTSQYISFGSVAIGGSCSMSAWMWADGWNFVGNDFGVTGILCKGFWGGDGNGDVRITIATNILQAEVRTSAGNFQATSATDRSGAWHQVGLVYDSVAQTLVLYVDGVAITTTPSVTGTLTSNARGIVVGAYPNNETNTEFDGRIAECAIWNGVALDAAQMASLGKGFSPLFYRSGLVFYAPLIGKASPEPNLLGGTGTVTGATASAHPRVLNPGQVQSVPLSASGAESPTHRITEEFIEVPYRDAASIPANLARLTEEFVEVPYRDPIVSAPARVTEEFAEIAYRSPISVLVDGVRLTQQSVEVLYLLPDSSDPFNDCGHFTGLREWEIRVYDHHDPNTGKRKAYGPDGEDLNGLVGEINFEIQERGGYGGGACEFLVPWEDVDLAGTERVDVWLWDEPAYRGYLRIAQKDLGATERARPQFYGMVAILDQWIVKRRYAYGCDTDVATIARDIALDYVAITGRFPNVSLDMSTPVQATLKEYDGRGKSVAQCFNELADIAPNQVIWGARMDSSEPVPGDVLYFSPRPTTTAYVIPVGDNVTAFAYPVDTHDITNSLAPLKGGTVKQPNVAQNGSFEELMPASEDNGNYLTDHDFEAGGSAWTGIGGSGSGPTIKQAGAAGAFGSGRSGQYWLELDTSSEEAYQDCYIVPGLKYTASCWCRLENGTPNSGTLILEGYNSAGVLVTTTSVGLTPDSTTYERFSVTQDLASYSTVVRLRVRLYGNGGTASNDGILIDDVGLYEECGVGQQYWSVMPRGNATLADVEWDCTSVTPRTGEYCIKIEADNIGSSSDTVDVYTPSATSQSIDANERYTLIVWWQTAGLGTVAADAFNLGAATYTAANVLVTDNRGDTVTIPGTPPSTWRIAYLEFTTDSTASKVQTYIRVRTETPIYFDDVMLVKGEVPGEVRDNGGYWPADTYQRYIDVEATVANTDGDTFASMLDTGVSASITTYGDHEVEVTNELVTDLDTALAFAAGTFNAKALPKVEAQLDIYAARKLIAQDGKVRLVNLPSAPSALWPARSTYTITAESINCAVELGNTRPDLQSLLELTAKRAKS